MKYFSPFGRDARRAERKWFLDCFEIKNKKIPAYAGNEYD